MVHNDILWQVQFRPNVAQEIARKLLTGFKLLVLKHVREVSVLEVAK